MSFITEVLGLARKDTVTTKGGNEISISQEATAAKAIEYATDGGNYITFQQYAQDIKGEIIDINHITQEMIFCALIKFKIIEKRATNSYIPPSEIYEQMKGKDGQDTIGFYRKRSGTNGTGFGFDLETINQLNNEYKAKIVDLVQELEDKLDIAEDEAKEFGEYLRQKHRETKQGKPSVHMEVKALFEVSKRKLIKQYLEC